MKCPWSSVRLAAQRHAWLGGPSACCRCFGCHCVPKSCSIPCEHGRRQKNLEARPEGQRCLSERGGGDRRYQWEWQARGTCGCCPYLSGGYGGQSDHLPCQGLRWKKSTCRRARSRRECWGARSASCRCWDWKKKPKRLMTAQVQLQSLNVIAALRKDLLKGSRHIRSRMQAVLRRGAQIRGRHAQIETEWTLGVRASH